MQIMVTVMSTNSKSFNEVVLVEYPRKDIWVIAFVTSSVKGEIDDKINNDFSIEDFAMPFIKQTSRYKRIYHQKPAMFTPEQCRKVIDCGRRQPPQKAQVGMNKSEGKLDTKKRVTTISWIPFKEMPEMYNDLNRFIISDQITYHCTEKSSQIITKWKTNV